MQNLFFLSYPEVMGLNPETANISSRQIDAEKIRTKLCPFKLTGFLQLGVVPDFFYTLYATFITEPSLSQT